MMNINTLYLYIDDMCNTPIFPFRVTLIYICMYLFVLCIACRNVMYSTYVDAMYCVYMFTLCMHIIMCLVLA